MLHYCLSSNSDGVIDEVINEVDNSKNSEYKPHKWAYERKKNIGK